MQLDTTIQPSTASQCDGACDVNKLLLVLNTAYVVFLRTLPIIIVQPPMSNVMLLKIEWFKPCLFYTNRLEQVDRTPTIPFCGCPNMF